MVQKIRVNVIYVFYVLFFLFMLHRLLFASSGILEKTMSYIAYPFLQAKSYVIYPLQQLSSYSQSMSQLQKEVHELVRERDALRAQVIELESVHVFHHETQELRRFAQRYDVKNKTLAHILFKNISEKEDVILIDAGERQSIQKDDVVVNHNMLVGRVIEVYPWYSKVALLTDQRCKISAQCKKGVSGICCGKNGGHLELNFVPHFKEVSIGDTLFSTGKGLIYPKGFGLGTVAHVQSDNVSHYITVDPILDIDKIDYVYVLSK